MKKVEIIIIKGLFADSGWPIICEYVWKNLSDLEAVAFVR